MQEGRQGLQSGPEVPSWRWLQHMVNFHNYSLAALSVNGYPIKACHPSLLIVNFSLDCSTCVRPGVIVCTKRACGRFDIKSIIITLQFIWYSFIDLNGAHSNRHV